MRTIFLAYPFSPSAQPAVQRVAEALRREGYVPRLVPLVPTARLLRLSALHSFVALAERSGGPPAPLLLRLVLPAASLSQPAAPGLLMRWPLPQVLTAFTRLLLTLCGLGTT